MAGSATLPLTTHLWHDPSMLGLATHERPRARALAVIATLTLVACGQPGPTGSGSASAPLSTGGPSVEVSASGGPPPPGPTGSPFGTRAESPSLAATSTQTTTPGHSEPSSLKVVETGFTAFSANGNDFASFAAILENPNDAWAALRMQITVDFFDADDAFVAGDELFVQVLPGQRTAVAGEAFGAGRATRMAIGIPEDTTAFEPAQGGEGFAISQVRTSRDGGLNRTTGRLTNRTGSDESSVLLTAVYRNGADEIIGGATGAVESARSGQTVEFEILDGAPYRDIASTEVHWQVSGLRR